MNYDMLTRTRYKLEDVPRSFTWVDLRDFVHYLDSGSALWQEMNPDWNGWNSQLHAENMLADIYDLLNAIRVQHANANSKHRQKSPDPYPRPNQQKDTKKMGSGAVKVGTFMTWWQTKEVD